MNKFVIRINKKTIKKNKNAGATSYFVPGQIEYSSDGSMRRNVQQVYTLTPEPDYYCDYILTEIQCNECKETFLHTELKADYIPFGDDEIWSNTVCPKCGIFDCCEIEYEKFEESMINE